MRFVWPEKVTGSCIVSKQENEGKSDVNALLDFQPYISTESEFTGGFCIVIVAIPVDESKLVETRSFRRLVVA